MSLQCHECKSDNTEIYTKKQLEVIANQPKKLAKAPALLAGGVCGICCSPEIIIAGVSMLATVASTILSIYGNNKNSEKFIYCKDCGHWEKL